MVELHASAKDQHGILVDELVEQLLNGIEAQQPAALQQLYDLYGEQVFSLAMAVTHSRETAEEITQDVFLRVWRKIAHYESGTNFRAWLLRIARNLSIDHLRRNRHAQALSLVWDVDALPDRAVLPEDDKGWVLHALHQLSEPQRQAIELAFLQGMTHEQIAARLETPLGTVKTRIRDGLRNLREAFLAEEQQL